MALQEFLLQKFKTWKPAAPEVVNRTKRDITMSWSQEEFVFLEDDLLYRVEKNNRLPKWVVVYSGGKTLKRIDDLAPSHPHRFRLKVILKASAVPRIADKALQYYGDENTVYEKLSNNSKDTEEQNGNTKENGKVENGGGDDVNIETVIEEKGTVETNESNIKHFGEKFNNLNEDKPTTRCAETQKWVESLYSAETWTSTDSEGTSVVCFCMAVKCGYYKQIQCMLEERPDLLGIVNAVNGFTPLATAVRTGDVNLSKFILSLGAEVDQTSCAGQTALHLAALAGHATIADLLIESGADFQARDWNGLRVEHYAVDSGNVEMVKLIFDRGGDVKAADFNGWTPLFRALCQGASTEMVEELVARGSDVDAVDNAGLPLMSVAKLLKSRHGRSRGSVLRLVDTNYPHEKALANFTRLTRKIYSVHTLFKST